jgi:hypothetical protein
VPDDIGAANNMIDTCLATALRADRSTVRRSLGISPGAFVYQRDMLLDIPLIDDMTMIRQRRQVLIDERLRRSMRSKYRGTRSIEADPAEGFELSSVEHSFMVEENVVFRLLSKKSCHVAGFALDITYLHFEGFSLSRLFFRLFFGLQYSAPAERWTSKIVKYENSS